MAVLAFDTFQRPDENPLNPAVWTVMADGVHYNSNPLQIVSHECETVATDNPQGAELYTGIAWPNNQWSKLTIGALTPLANIGVRLMVRGATSYSGYELRAAGDGSWLLFQWILVSPTLLDSGSGVTFSPGDTLYLSANGTTVVCKHNNTTLSTVTDSGIASGTAGIECFVVGPNALNSAQISAWLGGDFAAPNPTSIAPPVGSQGDTLDVMVDGTKFDANGLATLSFSGTGITVNSYSVRTATQIVANITIDPAAALTARTVTVTNPSDGQTGTLVAAFTVTIPVPPIPASSLVEGVSWGASGPDTWVTGPSRIINS